MMQQRHFYLFLYLVSDRCFFSYSFNIDIENPIVYLDQTNYLNVNKSDKSSFFGLSVILYPGDNIYPPWIQIGAPRANSPTVKYKNPGIIFRCNIGGPCQYLEIDKEFGQIDNKNGIYFNKMDDAWLGATMDINIKSNRSVVCAPRWMNFYTRQSAGQTHRDYRMLGACYWSHLNTHKFHKKLPLFDNAYDIYTDKVTGETVYNYGQGESGFAVHMPVAEKELIIGAPGIFNWKGSVIRYKDKKFNDANPIASRYSSYGAVRESLSDIEIFYEANVANSRTIVQTLAFGYFGYAVTSGYFYSEMTLHYAGGAPRSKNYLGQVLIYDFQDKHNQFLVVKDSKQGIQFGEYFGASLAGGDINNDGLDDLFVGAPFHKASKYNEGRVYLYLGSKKGTLQEPLQGKFIDGTQPNGQFGTTITYLGDMNYDQAESYRHKLKYVAISAPYEEGSGVVYIYKGTALGLDTIPVQKIVGKNIYSSLSGFGISISKPSDIDGNGYKDIAIGSHKSGHMVLLRSRPLVRLNFYFQTTPAAISDEIREFDVELCHEYYSFKGLPSAQITRKIVIDEDFNRAFLKSRDNETRRLILNERRPSCENITIKMRESWPNAYDPLTLKVIDNLVEEKGSSEKIVISDKIQGTDHFCQRCGVYDPFRSSQTFTTTIPFVLGCGDDNVCHSELEFESNFKGIGVQENVFILGSTNVVELETVVINKGEKAYLLRLQVDLPEGLSFKQTPTLCEQNQTRIICPVANPLNSQEQRSLSLKIDMDYVNKRIEENFLFINVTVLTNSLNKNGAFKMVVLGLKTEADISITGKSGEQSYSFGNDSNSNVEFQQIFQIGKYGLSPVSLIAFEIHVPYAIRTKSGLVNFISLYQPEGYLEGGQSLIFNSEIPYLEEHKFGSTDITDQEKTFHEIRNRREIDFPEVELVQSENSNIALMSGHFKESQDDDLLGNRTFEIDCNSSEIMCGKVSGKTGPFEGLKKSAVMQLRLLIDTKALSGSLQKHSIIRFSTYGIVKIEDPPNLVQSGRRPDTIIVSSLFVNDSEKKKIDTWIIVVSVISGLLLLLILTLLLTKAGFFKRSKKQELEQLKSMSGIDNAGTSLKATDEEY